MCAAMGVLTAFVGPNSISVRRASWTMEMVPDITGTASICISYERMLRVKKEKKLTVPKTKMGALFRNRSV